MSVFNWFEGIIYEGGVMGDKAATQSGTLTWRLNQIKSDIDNTNTALSSVNTQLQSNQSTSSGTNSRLDTVNTNLSTINNTNLNNGLLISGTYGKLDLIHTDLSSTNTKLDTGNFQTSGTNIRLDTLHGDNLLIESKLDTINTNISGTDIRLDAVNTNLGIISTNQAAQATAVNQVSSNTKLDTLHTDLGLNGILISGSNIKLDTIHADLGILNTDILATNTKLDTVNSQISGTNTRLDTANTDLSTINTTIGSSNTSLSHIDVNTSGTKASVDLLAPKLDTIILNTTGTDVRLDTLHADHLVIESKLDSITSNTSGTNSSLGTVNTNLGILHTDITAVSTNQATAANQVLANTKLDTLHADLASDLVLVSGSNVKLDTLHTDLTTVISNQASQSTAANQTAANTKLDTLHVDISGTNTKLDTVIASLALEATAANQVTMNSKLDSIILNTTGTDLRLDTINTNLGIINADIVATNSRLDTVNTNISGTNAKLDIVNTDLININTKLGDKTQTTRITDGTNTAGMTSAGELYSGSPLVVSSGTVSTTTTLELDLKGLSYGSWAVSVDSALATNGWLANFEATQDGLKWVRIYGYRLIDTSDVGGDSASEAPVQSISSTSVSANYGVWVGHLGSFKKIRLNITTWVGGSGVFTLTASQNGNLANGIPMVNLLQANSIAAQSVLNFNLDNTSVSCDGKSSFTVNLAGTWVGNIFIYGQDSTGNNTLLECFQTLSAGGYNYSQPFLAGGEVIGSCAGFQTILVRMESYVSGSCSAAITAGLGSTTARIVGQGTDVARPLFTELSDGINKGSLNSDGSVPTTTREILVNINSSPIDQINGIDRIREFDTITGSATITNSGGSDGTYKLHTTAATTDDILLESNVRGVCTSSSGIECGVTLCLMDGTLPAHGFCRMGYWDASDGAYFGIDQTSLFLTTRKSTTEATVTRITSFSVDKLDGTGPSGMVWAAAVPYTYIIRMFGDVYGTIEWYVRGPKTSTSTTIITALVHRSTAVNGTTLVGALNLPVKVEMSNNANATSWNIKLGTRYIHTIGPYTPMTRNSSHLRTALAMGNNTTYLPIVSFRKKSSNLIHTRCIVDKMTFIPSAAMIFTIYVNNTLTGASFVAPFNGAANDSSLEFDVSATAITTTNAWVIYNDTIPSGINRVAEDILATYPAGTIVTLAGRLVAANTAQSISAMFNVREEW